MKSIKLLSSLAIVFTIFFEGSTARADTIYVGVNDGRHRLPECGGTVEINNGGNDKHLNAVFRDVEQCSNYKDAYYREYKLQGKNQDRSGSYTVLDAKDFDPGKYTATLQLYSNWGVHSDTIVVSFGINRN